MFKMTFINEIDTEKIVDAADNDMFWMRMANEWYRLLQKYIPRDSGDLMENVAIAPKEIIHMAPYANLVYNWKEMNFSKKKNPYATAVWDVAARATELPKLISFGNEYINRNF